MIIEDELDAIPPYVQLPYLTADECRQLRDELRQHPELSPGLVGSGVSGSYVIDPMRVCNTQELIGERYQWLYDRLKPIVREANECFRFDLYGMLDNLTYMQYLAAHEASDGAAGHFQWHTDAGRHLSALRKISLSIALSDPDTYEGGHLQLFHGGVLDAGKLPLGTVTAFPSYVQHRVTPMISGERCVLVLFILGPRFR